MAKIVCVFYEDPVTGYQRAYARDDIPDIERYPGGQTTPTPKSIDFRPGQLLGSVRGWNIADCVARSYDLEGMNVGTVAAGRIGTAVLRRLKPFDVKLHYTDRHRLPEAIERELDLMFHATRKAPANRLTAEASIGNGGEERGGHHDYCNIRAALSGARRRSLRDDRARAHWG
jgi:hypothetical protein